MKNWVLDNYRAYLIIFLAFISADMFCVYILDYYFTEESQFKLFILISSILISIYVIGKVTRWVLSVNKFIRGD